MLIKFRTAMSHDKILLVLKQTCTYIHTTTNHPLGILDGSRNSVLNMFYFSTLDRLLFNLGVKRTAVYWNCQGSKTQTNDRQIF